MEKRRTESFVKGVFSGSAYCEIARVNRFRGGKHAKATRVCRLVSNVIVRGNVITRTAANGSACR